MSASKFSVGLLRSMVSEATNSGKNFVLNRSSVVEVLQAFVARSLTRQNVVDWAEFFDVNEDVELESDALLPDVLFELSSPEINGELDLDRARKLIVILSNTKQ